ncbi:DUF3742 family protein [Salinisphaera orenii]|uniref:DUF3742 family protein n=1 Tax=Salinisphaera orenii TaxID=856731 RepID=UPI000DBE775E
MTTHTPNVQPRPTPLRALARWLGVGALGLVAWILLSVVTALLDPRAEGAGLIGAFDSLSAFLATGAALTAVPMIAYTIHRHGFGQWATIGIASALVAMVLGLAVMHWHAVLITMAVVTLLGLMLKNGIPDTILDEGDEDGWRNGWQGFGWYVQGVRIDNETE